MKKRLAQLKQLADMVKDAELSRLSSAAARREEIEAEGAALQAQRRGSYGSADCGLTHLSDAAEKWRGWADHQIRQNRLDEARAAAEVEDCKNRALHAFGRADAIDRLIRKTR